MQPAVVVLNPPLSLKQFLLRGLLGCLIGTAVGYYNFAFLLLAIPGAFGNDLVHIALWGLSGIIAGAIQGSFFGHAARPTLLWLLLTAISWLVVGFFDAHGTISNFLYPYLVGYQFVPALVMAISFVYGGCAASLQWLLPRRSLPFAAWWLPLSASTWSILGSVAALQSHFIYDSINWIINQVLR